MTCKDRRTPFFFPRMVPPSCFPTYNPSLKSTSSLFEAGFFALSDPTPRVNGLAE
eukprot:m.1741 g.1741  ORF g.1741 m.1741 type:complete len:55 (+) comp591_c0_seq1:278-442(+)